MVTQSEIQYPRLRGEKKFQDFCLALARRYWNDPHAQLHGRQGQAQHGVDITGEDTINQLNPVAMQAKGSESNNARKLKDADLIEEVEKAKKFNPPLKLLIVAYNGERDQVLQKKAIELTTQHQNLGLFKVVLWAWDDILAEAEKFPEVIGELVLENKFPVAGHLDPARPRGDLAAPLQKIQAALADAQAAYLEAAAAAPNDDPVSNAKIDVWKEQIATGSGAATVKPLKAFIAALAPDASARVRFRAHANLGAALIQVGDNQAAEVAFEEAAKVDPETADGHAYAARVAVFRNELDVAYLEAGKALDLDPASKLAAALLIDAAPPEALGVELEARLPGIVGEFDVGWALVRRYSANGDYENALRAARQIAVNEANWARGVAIADAILSRFENDLAMRVGAPVSAEAKSLLDEARDALEAIWASVKGRDDHKNWAFVGNNLASTYNLMGDEEKADVLSLEAYRLDPDVPAFRQRAALAYIHRGENHKAIELAEQVAASGEADDHLFAASIQTLSKDWTAVQESAQAAFDGGGEDDTKSRAAELLVVSDLQLRGPAKAFATAQALRRLIKTTVSFEARVTEVARRLGEEEALKDARARLAAFDIGALSPIERFELSDAYADDGQWSRAADLLDGLHETDRPSVILKRRLFALYRAERRADARMLYESLSGKAVQSMELLRLGAAIYERSGLLQKALTALDTAIALDPLDLRSRLDWCRLWLRSGEETKVTKWIRKADAAMAGDPDDILEFAQLLHRYGRQVEAFQIAYDVLRTHWGESERLHTMFMSLFLGAPNPSDAMLHPSVVAEDCVVFLENEHGAKVDYRIEQTAKPAPDVLSPDNAFAKSLIGAAVGDQREGPSGVGQAATWTVTEIKHKFLDLFHRVMESHTTVFPASRALGMVHVAPGQEGGFEPVFEQVRARARLAGEMGKFYENNVVPIDAVARALGLDPIDASLGLRGRLNIRIDTCVGAEDERRNALRQLAGADAVMVEPLTLAIWQEIGLLEVLGAMDAPRVEMTQTTIDVIAARADEAAQAIGRGGGSLEAHGEQIVLHENNDAALQETVKIWSDLAQWCRDHATMVPVEVNPDLQDHGVGQLLSVASIDTLATAAAGNRALVCDDRRLRMVGATIGVARAGWTQVLLGTLAATGKITRTQYVGFLAELAQRKIGFVSVGALDLLEAQAAADKSFEALAEALTHPKVEPLSLVHVMSEFATELWSNRAMVVQRDRLISILSERLLTRDDGLVLWVEFANRTYHAIKGFKRPLNLLAKFWGDYITRFANGHFLNEAIAKLR